MGIERVLWCRPATIEEKGGRSGKELKGRQKYDGVMKWL